MNNKKGLPTCSLLSIAVYLHTKPTLETATASKLGVVSNKSDKLNTIT